MAETVEQAQAALDAARAYRDQLNAEYNASLAAAPVSKFQESRGVKHPSVAAKAALEAQAKIVSDKEKALTEARTAEKPPAKDPNAFDLGESSALSQANAQIKAKNPGRARLILQQAKYPDEWIDAYIGGGGPSGDGEGGGGGRGSSGVAAAGANLRAQLQNAIQTKKINLDTAKAISKDYFDALTESRQREQLSQDAFATAQKANSDYLTTERAKMDLVSPENAKLFQSLVGSLGSASGSNFRVPDSWVESQNGVQVNADVLGGNYAKQQPRDIQNMLETVGRTPDAINGRVLAGAAATNGGARPAASDLPFTAGPGMTPAQEKEVNAYLRNIGIDPRGDLTAGDNGDEAA